jgi:hypothetical protein
MGDILRFCAYRIAQNADMLRTALWIKARAIDELYVKQAVECERLTILRKETIWLYLR